MHYALSLLVTALAAVYITSVIIVCRVKGSLVLNPALILLLISRMKIDSAAELEILDFDQKFEQDVAKYGIQKAVVIYEKYLEDEKTFIKQGFSVEQLRAMVISPQGEEPTPTYLQLRAVGILMRSVSNLEAALAEYLIFYKQPSVSATAKEWLVQLVFRYAKTEDELTAVQLKVAKEDYLYRTAETMKDVLRSGGSRSEARVIEMKQTG